MKMDRTALVKRAIWEAKKVHMPAFDWDSMMARTRKAPVWVHFGAGNIFRGFIANLQQSLLDQGLEETGIIAVETYDYEIIDQIYKPYDNMTMLVSMGPNGETDRRLIASLAEGVKADSSDPEVMPHLKTVFCNPSLQMVSFTITEKGYALHNLQGELLAEVKKDMDMGPETASHTMSLVTALLMHRYQHGAAPLALVSMDNCSHNGEKLRNAVLTIAEAWQKNGFAEVGFMDYLCDKTRISFPWSMIDKITPRPDTEIAAALAKDGFEGMNPIITKKNTFIAAFVNSEVPQYLVIEDCFPNGRPVLEKAGVYMTNQDTVKLAERMKVETCLNPLHTALAVFGCLLRKNTISEAMKDEDLLSLVRQIGYNEGMPVVAHPGIIDPKFFLDEVISTRLPNPSIPDTPQRIITDTSQKMAVRFGETIKAYNASETLSVKSLTGIALVIAAWIRYLLAVDDEGNPMQLSADPMLDELQKRLKGVTIENSTAILSCILNNILLFGSDLTKNGLSDLIIADFNHMLAGKGAVRTTLHCVLNAVG